MDSRTVDGGALFLDGTVVRGNVCGIVGVFVDMVVADRLGVRANLGGFVDIDATVDVTVVLVLIEGAINENYKVDFAIDGSEDGFEEMADFLGGVEGWDLL
ncbi:hypothetical protein NDU88_000956 [Pleurodeles waltl]|uniref:Uncharacterized protein n=1 Tax=Pleurodeles waltl TaxID=8319 RepID=A0AAV7P5P2_PLEWA|nr:hypothetical protein NDU88_000956 [Pleurodeles waltl]